VKVHFTWAEGSDRPDKPQDPPDKVQVRRTRFRFPTILASKMAEQGSGPARHVSRTARQAFRPGRQLFDATMRFPDEFPTQKGPVANVDVVVVVVVVE
jgi:hypothetical protein